MTVNFVKQNSQPHRRRIIRHRVRQLIRQWVDVASDKVFISRPNPVFVNEVPCILIYFTEEPSDNKTSAPKRYVRDLNLVVEIMHRDRENITDDEDFELDDFLDSRAYEVEFAILHERYLGLDPEEYEWLHEVDLTSTMPATLVFEGDQRVAALRVVFSVKYETDYDESIRLDEFLKFTSKYETTIGAEAEDRVTIREE